MSIALVSMHSPEYIPLAELTGEQNKKLYCERHGFLWYDEELDVEYFRKGFCKFHIIKDAFLNEDVDVAWFTGADSLITDFTNDLSVILEDQASFIISADCNGVNADSFMVRNNEMGNAFLSWCIASEHCLPDEQAAITHYLSHLNNGVGHVVSQRTMNSYDYDLYPNPSNCLDVYGNNGNWQYGDLLIHWPGFGGEMQFRLDQVARRRGSIKFE